MGPALNKLPGFLLKKPCVLEHFDMSVLKAYKYVFRIGLCLDIWAKYVFRTTEVQMKMS